LWTAQFPGLTYNRKADKFEVQRFFRELLTMGTILNLAVVGGLWEQFGFKQMMTLAFLTSDDRTATLDECEERVTLVSRIGGRNHNCDQWGQIHSFLEREEDFFDNDFPLVDYNDDDEAMFRLLPGHENKFLKDKYSLGPVGYFDIPACKPMERSYLFDLPRELKLHICRHLFKFTTPIAITYCKHNAIPADDLHAYEMSILRPPELQMGGEELYGEDGPHPDDHWLLNGDLDGLFALAGTCREFRLCMREVFFRVNHFVLSDFPYETTGDPDAFNLTRWKRVIGADAARYINRDRVTFVGNEP
jgi:hypothetical protein